MTRLLYVVANPNSAAHSFSKQIGTFFLEGYRQRHPGTEIVVKDLYADGVPLLNSRYFTAMHKSLAASGSQLDGDEKQMMQQVQCQAEEFLTFDRYLIAAPLWNFGVPPLLKGYIDDIVIAGKTFRYTDQGPVGLIPPDRKMVYIEASGGVYSTGPLARLNHGSRYVQDIMGFIGITQFNAIHVEGVALPQIASRAVEVAKGKVLATLEEF